LLFIDSFLWLKQFAIQNIMSVRIEAIRRIVKFLEFRAALVQLLFRAYFYIIAHRVDLKSILVTNLTDT
jgi:hypothetical protein